MAKKKTEKPAKPKKPRPRQQKKPPAAPLYAGTIAKAITVYGWFSRGCPRSTVEEVTAWRAANIRQEHVRNDKKVAEGRPPNGPIDAELTLAQKRVMADTRKIEAEVQYKEMRNAERRGDMISLTAVQREGAELVARIKERLLAAPDEFENRFPSEVRAQCKADFSEFIRQLLLEVSRWTIGGETVDDIILAVARRIEAERARHQAGGR